MSPFTVWQCPECGEQVNANMRGHYHSPPENWPGGEDPWFDAVAVETFSVEEIRERLAGLYSAAVRSQIVAEEQHRDSSVEAIRVQTFRDALDAFPTQQEQPPQQGEAGGK